MTTQYIRALRAEGQGGDGPIDFIASTEIPARDGMVIAADGWDLTNFRKNNLVLWAHDWFGNRPPIGKADVRIDKVDKVLRASVTFDMGDPFAADISRKYREGFLNAVSVGFDVKQMADEPTIKGEQDIPRVAKAELLEISAVPIPADPHALAERQQRGYAEIGDILAQLSEVVPDAQPSEFVWPGVAVLMARCYLDTNDDDDEREKQHRRLSREYRALGKEPPEWMTRSQLSLLGEPEIHGLFVSGEADMLGWEPDAARKGAVLSSRTFGDISQARDLLSAVLDRAAKGEVDPEDEEARTIRLLHSVFAGRAG
jgi:HK97 family phage prohead protease